MVRRTKDEAQKTRATILEAAMQILLLRGIARTHLADIAREAGLTRGAIYWHFANKDDLLNTLWKDLIDTNDFLFQVMENTDEFDPLGSLVEQLFVFLKKMPDNARRQQLFYLFLDENTLQNHHYPFHFNQKKFQLERLRKVENLLRNAIDKRQLPASIDVSLGAITIIAYVDGLTPQYQRLVDELGIKLNVSFLINGLMHMIRFGCVCHACS